MAALAGSLVVNIGTLDPFWISSMKSGMSAALEMKRPTVLDPVGAGATAFRTQTAMQLIEFGKPRVIRGNASEILALAGTPGLTKGVDSEAASQSARSAANDLARSFGCVVCASGATDYIANGRSVVSIVGGHALMSRVTAMGCTASSVIGAFLAVESDPFLATQAAMAVMSVAGELAAVGVSGPGTFQIGFLDSLSSIRSEDLRSRLRIAEER